MFTLTQRSFETLEWPQVTGALAARCRSPLGASLAVAHKPLPTLDARHALCHRIQETTLLRAQKPNLPGLLSDTADPRDFFERAARRGVLEPTEIWICGHFTATLGTIGTELRTSAAMAPLLAADFAEAPATPRLWAHIVKSVNPRGEILDTASPELGRLRGERAHCRASFERLLHTRVKEWHSAGFLQDDFYDVLDGRYVVPVRADQQGRLTGNLFSRSQSRQSLYIEPTELVAPNNELQEIDNSIRSEEYRILKSLSNQLGDLAPDYLRWAQPLGLLDLAFAAAHLAVDWHLRAPQTRSQVISHGAFKTKSAITLELPGLFHPLLLDSGVSPVSNDLVIDASTQGILISGPNTGGKTVLIKAAALAILMAQSGLFIAAQDGAVIPHYAGVLSLIGDDQNIAAGLSSFSSQIKDLNEILMGQTAPLFIVVDEILSSTDPEEASVLAQAITEELISRGHHLLVTTHFSDFAARLQTVKHSDQRFVGFIVAAMEFEGGRPTYRLRMNQMGASHALEVARHLGIPAAILDRAQSLRSRAKIDYEAAVVSLKKEQIQLTEDSQRLQNELEDKMAHRLEAERLALETERLSIRERYQAFIDRWDQWQKAFHEKFDTLSTVGRRRLPMGPRHDLTTSFVEMQNEAQRAQVAPPPQQGSKPLGHGPGGAPSDPQPERLVAIVGATVRMRSLAGATGVIAAIQGVTATVALNPAGKIKIQKPLSDLEVIAAPRQIKTPLHHHPHHIVEQTEVSRPSSSKLDLRGKRYDEAMSELHRFLDHSYRSGASQVTVVTGHGTGALKKGLKDLMKELPYVRETRAGNINSSGVHGDDGAVLIEFHH